jgi:hypothetical protein
MGAMLSSSRFGGPKDAACSLLAVATDTCPKWSGRVGKKSSARGAEWKRRTLPAAVAKKYKIGYFRRFLPFFHNFFTVSMLIDQSEYSRSQNSCLKAKMSVWLLN